MSPIRPVLETIWPRLRPRWDHPARGSAWLWSRDWTLVILAGFIGVFMSGVAVAFILPLRWLERQLRGVASEDRRPRPFASHAPLPAVARGVR